LKFSYVTVEKKSSWSCSSVAFYRQKPASDIAFSEDGSVLAVTFKDVVTLWDPEYNTMHPDVVSLGTSEVTIRYRKTFYIWQTLSSRRPDGLEFTAWFVVWSDCRVWTF